MNQKQRDHLIKRLVKIKDEKITGFHLDQPDPKPFARKLKVVKPTTLIKEVAKNFGLERVHNTTDNGTYVDTGKRYKEWRTGTKANGFNITGGEHISASNYFVNLKQIKKEYEKYCEKYYQQEVDRHEAIEKKYVEMCDKIIFAEDYKEAAKLIEQFLKF